ncbi:Surface presentation of antigens (SPOA) [Legionella quinlivanii]|uniref:Surface presentation of antigens (SPOA) n=1 Tax=Legionella quinlivanii TaxID=45073 RepID=A0A0W0XLS4_9GAMM|nr:FliM/FliN family flagellar motor C-terminal domain-containing protein [Legionella quinlivanii]KTD45380.1 Surface presentation of antigens (SPOA) [Legionella quinlivanii]MCW8451433.1 FliM/FliN family flagellar motor C-terminal domain-containing protein [Legionella quinlivanii]SEG14495.1 Type III flagellar switch regulator (C-ring) FliN C-term [Legionella quinlivanii DSM 21216]STY10364.1 Flagellar motor switch protein [Legionella quinlivanii]
MNQTLKPYRLINPSEISKLSRHFHSVLQPWNAVYTLSSASVYLQRACPAEASRILSLYNQTGELIGFISPSFFENLQQVIFGSSSSCFRGVNEQISHELLSALFQDNLSTQEEQLDIQEWFYRGSPCLELGLTFDQTTTSLFLHPRWVVEQLPVLSGNALLSPLESSLSDEQLELEIKLLSFTMNLADLLTLKPGEVIKTDHPQNEDLLLKHQQLTLCTVHKGSNDGYKSIQIASN